MFAELPDKALLQQKLAEWTQEHEEDQEAIEAAKTPSGAKPMKDCD
ncbi:MAG: hypothetical protein LBL72_03910 [Candidatus Accumulibacter sp.]|jgi:hypothetical protein|nr:hypothetical protein [Accumulibacter sp.]